MIARPASDAVALWVSIVDGRWTLVHHFDHDGRRFFVARRADRDEGEIARLSAREREVLALAVVGHANKVIAAELGLSPSGVAMHLSRVARKLGVRTRVALIEAYRRGFPR